MAVAQRRGGGGPRFNDEMVAAAMMFAAILLIIFFLLVIRLYIDKKEGKSVVLRLQRSPTTLIKRMIQESGPHTQP